MTKDFDAVEWMRKTRAEIDEQDRDLDWQEKARQTIEQLRDDPVWQRLKSRVVKSTEAGRSA